MTERLPFDPKSLKALIADPHDLIRKSIARIFHKLNFAEVYECHNGKDAKALLISERIDIVVCDLQLGGITGLELLDFIRSLETGSDIPFLILSGESEKDDIVKAVDKGADDYLLKPFQPENIEKKVLKILADYQSPGPLLAKIRQVEKLLHSKFWHEALELVDKVIEQKPDSPRASHLKAVIYAKSGQQEEAIRELKENLKNYPSFLKNYASIADLYYNTKNYSGAIAAMSQELTLNPKQIHRQIKLANLLLKEGDIRGAVDHYRQALLENNRHPEALYGMGAAYAKGKNLDKAIYYFKRMRRHHPEQLKPLQAIVKYCLILEQPRIAELALRDEKKTHPERADTYSLLADFYFGQDREEEALELLWSALKRKSDWEEIYLRLAKYYLGKEKYDKAAEIFDQAYAENKDPNVYIQKAELFLKVGKYSEAIAALHSAMTPGVDHVKLYRLLVSCTMKTKQYGKSYFILTHLKKSGQKDSLVVNYSKEVRQHLLMRRNKGRPAAESKVS